MTTCLWRKLLIPLKENNFSAETNVLKQVRGRVPLGSWIGRSLSHRTYSPVTNMVYSCAMGAHMFGSVSICVWLLVCVCVCVCVRAQKPFLPKGNWKLKSTSKKVPVGTSLVAQWLRICLPMQGTQVRALVREDPTCRGETKPVRHNYWACALEPTSHNYWSPCATTTVAPQQEKPPQWEAHARQRRVAPACRS